MKHRWRHDIEAGTNYNKDLFMTLILNAELEIGLLSNCNRDKYALQRMVGEKEHSGLIQFGYNTGTLGIWVIISINKNNMWSFKVNWNTVWQDEKHSQSIREQKLVNYYRLSTVNILQNLQNNWLHYWSCFLALMEQWSHVPNHGCCFGDDNGDALVQS